MEGNTFFMKDRITKDDMGGLMLFEDEEPIFALREHWLTLLFRATKITLVGLIVGSISSIVVYYVLQSWQTTVLAGFFVLLVAAFIMLREFIHWSLHLYVATSKQLIEIHYNPLFSHVVNSVLLEQIRCTEIDVDMFGIVPELIGIGNVILTFDRPTHKEEFVLKGIRSPRRIANILSTQIYHTKGTKNLSNSQPLWIKELETNKYKYVGDVNYGY